MFPQPKILNTNVLPPSNNIVEPKNVYYRGNSNGTVSRLATLGTEYTLSEANQSRVQFKIVNWFSISQPGKLDSKMMFRFRFNGSYSNMQISPWNAGQLFKLAVSANTWHEVRVEYASTATGTHKWYVNNVLRYSGPKFAAMDLFFNATGVNNELLFDVGNRGGLLVDGYVWWNFN